MEWSNFILDSPGHVLSPQIHSSQQLLQVIQRNLCDVWYLEEEDVVDLIGFKSKYVNEQLSRQNGFIYR